MRSAAKDGNNDEHRRSVLANIMDDVNATFEKLRDEGKAAYMMTQPYTVPAARIA